MAKSVEVAVPVAPTAPVKLTGTESKYASDPEQTVIIRPVADIHVGGSDVTTGNGLLIAAGTTSAPIKTGEALFAIAAVATTARVLRIGAS